MKTTTVITPAPAPFMGGIAAIASSRFGNRIRFDVPNEGGAETAETKPDEQKPETSETKPAEKVETKPEAPKLSDKEADLLKEVMAKKKANETLQAQIDAANARLKEFEGLDPVKAKELIAAAEAAELKAAQDRGDFERVKEMMAEQHRKEAEALQARINELEGVANTKSQTINELTIGQAFQGSAFIADELILTPNKARAAYGAHFEVEGGRMVGYDKPKGEEGRTKLVDASGNPVGFDDAIKRLVEADPDRDSLVKSKLVTGGKSGGDGTKAPVSTTGLTGRARIEAVMAAQAAVKK